MKIFAAGIATETNTFSPIPTTREDFRVQRGRGSDPLAGRIPFPSLNLFNHWGELARERGHEFVFGFMAEARPAGITVRRAYESLRDELLNDVKAAMPVDIVLLNLHGAMVADGCEGCEEDIIRRVRAIVGADAVIGVELDLHCHLSRSMIEQADLVITYKEYPHVDVIERGRELFALAVSARSRAIRPAMALFDCHMVGLYATSGPPMRGFVDAMLAAEREKRVLSVSFGHGFQFADLPHIGAKVLVVTDNDPALAEEVAREFGLRVYALRHEIGLEKLAMTLEAALTRALGSTRTPVVVADQSDNAGGGAPGDSTFALRWLLDHEARDVAMAIFYDPEVVKAAKKVGVGTNIAIRLGGKLGPTSGEPIDLRATVSAIHPQYMHSFPQQSGEPLLFPVGDVVALHCNGIDVVVSSERCQCFSPSIFMDLGIDPKSKKILIPKSIQHFYGAFAPLAGEVIYMAAPGAVAPDPRTISYRRFDTCSAFPWLDDPLARICRG
jgi:microcystin degradation protein MlrC